MPLWVKGPALGQTSRRTSGNQRRYRRDVLRRVALVRIGQRVGIPLSEIAEVLDDSVAKHMRADVTVGSFLSSGIDSTAIAALAHKYNQDLVTFTVGFQRESTSEVEIAAESAAILGVEHVPIEVSAQEFADAIPAVVWYLDDPVADPALVPLYFVARGDGTSQFSDNLPDHNRAVNRFQRGITSQ